MNVVSFSTITITMQQMTLLFCKIYFPNSFRTAKISAWWFLERTHFTQTAVKKILTLFKDKSVKWCNELCYNFLKLRVCVFGDDALLSDGLDKIFLCRSDVFQEGFFESCDAWRIHLVKMTPDPSVDYSHLFSDFHGNYNKTFPCYYLTDTYNKLELANYQSLNDPVRNTRKVCSLLENWCLFSHSRLWPPSHSSSSRDVYNLCLILCPVSV